MRAAVFSSYGPPEVVQIREVEKPALGLNDILIRVHATTLCPADWRYRKADPSLSRLFSGLFRPTKIRILGMEFAGTVEATGQSVTRFGTGDQVFGATGFQKMGAHAEYLCVSENSVVAVKPTNMTFEEAAGVLYGGLSALHFLRKAKIRLGQRVLIYGASGSVGIFAVQLAKHFGAHVTGVCSTKNLDLVKSLGADEVIDYTKDDFSKSGRIYDIVLDSVGKSGYSRSLRSLKRGGFYVRVGGSGRLSSIVGSILAGTWISLTGAARFVGGVTQGGREAQAFLKDLIEAGKIRTVIDRRYSLDQIVEAHRYVEAGHKIGNVVIVV
jgi:NADPH:quinone reductase-like Zn-dependent oxidoreductase